MIGISLVNSSCRKDLLEPQGTKHDSKMQKDPFLGALEPLLVGWTFDDHNVNAKLELSTKLDAKSNSETLKSAPLQIDKALITRLLSPSFKPDPSRLEKFTKSALLNDYANFGVAKTMLSPAVSYVKDLFAISDPNDFEHFCFSVCRNIYQMHEWNNEVQSIVDLFETPKDIKSTAISTAAASTAASTANKSIENPLIDPITQEKMQLEQTIQFRWFDEKTLTYKLHLRNALAMKQHLYVARQGAKATSITAFVKVKDPFLAIEWSPAVVTAIDQHILTKNQDKEFKAWKSDSNKSYQKITREQIKKDHELSIRLQRRVDRGDHDGRGGHGNHEGHEGREGREGLEFASIPFYTVFSLNDIYSAQGSQGRGGRGDQVGQRARVQDIQPDENGYFNTEHNFYNPGFVAHSVDNLALSGGHNLYANQIVFNTGRHQPLNVSRDDLKLSSYDWKNHKNSNDDQDLQCALMLSLNSQHRYNGGTNRVARPQSAAQSQQNQAQSREMLFQNMLRNVNMYKELKNQKNQNIK